VENSSSEEDAFYRDGPHRKGKADLEAEMQPVNANWAVNWDHVGGLQQQVDALKECILHPLLYSDLYDTMGVTPPRGVLLHGPPGCGKTLVARALAGECKAAGLPVTFFARKGSDLQSKWVGEAERRVCALFEVARRRAPSVIFFDEVDGLAPSRTQGGEEASHHNAIVTTLLACIDGFEALGKVAILAATNRPDLLDAALRRPGRLDREVYFPPPDAAQRRHILEVVTRRWPDASREPGVGGASPEFLSKLAGQTAGSSGADLQNLCSQAAIASIRRACPHVYTQSARMDVTGDDIQVTEDDFKAALDAQLAAKRASSVSKHLMSSISIVEELNPMPLAATMSSLLKPSLDEAQRLLKQLFPPWGGEKSSSSSSSSSSRANSGLSRQARESLPDLLGCKVLLQAPSQRLLQMLEPALLWGSELPAFIVRLDSDVTGVDEVGAFAIRAVKAAVASAPSALLLPSLHSISSRPQVVRSLYKALEEIPPNAPVLVVGTMVLQRPAEAPVEERARKAQKIVGKKPQPFRRPVTQARVPPQAGTVDEGVADSASSQRSSSPVASTDISRLVDSFHKVDIMAMNNEHANSFFLHILSQGTRAVVESLLRERIVKEDPPVKPAACPDPDAHEDVRVAGLSEDKIKEEEEEEEYWFRLLRKQVRQILKSLGQWTRFSPFVRRPDEMRAALNGFDEASSPITLTEMVEKNDAGKYHCIADVRQDFLHIKSSIEAVCADSPTSAPITRLRACACELVDEADTKLECVDRDIDNEVARLSVRRERREAAKVRLASKDDVSVPKKKVGRPKSDSSVPAGKQSRPFAKGTVLPDSLSRAHQAVAQNLSSGCPQHADDDVWLDRVLEQGRSIQDGLYHALFHKHQARDRLKALTDAFDRHSSSKAAGYSPQNMPQRLAAFYGWCDMKATAPDAEKAIAEFLEKLVVKRNR